MSKFKSVTKSLMNLSQTVKINSLWPISVLHPILLGMSLPYQKPCTELSMVDPHMTKSGNVQKKQFCN